MILRKPQIAPIPFKSQLQLDAALVIASASEQQTSTGANQTSAASQELSRLAVDLNTMVARFSV
ncbi:hypothetical protein RJC98_03425 [Pseudomonas allii]|uniref:Uncharacterized protein n=2 Tax=Pseudomonas allii TaxID=2740531 RepID=A0ACC6L7E9_9PSED|nr:hypothetical protein [Pseudomonas allii]MDR9874220.1 hypothetical protein [Pseudomonas allii]NWN47545.1 hypothetical protein [Pseudomonas allii]NWN61553.1 hypothetical protein [Pseudomonas allii]RMP75443.1 hypothetical protein ALQ17_01078 [Pseudomonas fluorescens]